MLRAALYSFIVDGDLPSGMQAEDIWEALQLFLWFADRKAAEKKKALAAANAKAKLAPVVLDGGETDDAGADKRADGGGAKGMSELTRLRR